MVMRRRDELHLYLRCSSFVVWYMTAGSRRGGDLDEERLNGGDGVSGRLKDTFYGMAYIELGAWRGTCGGAEAKGQNEVTA